MQLEHGLMFWRPSSHRNSEWTPAREAHVRDTGIGFAAVIDVRGTPSCIGERDSLQEAIELARPHRGSWCEHWTFHPNGGCLVSKVVWRNDTGEASKC